jgi:O-antigen/teichoic acid export membrane protein
MRAARVSTLLEPVAGGRRARLQEIRNSRLFRQNLILFFGGFTSGVGGFVYHAVAGHELGTRLYGQVSALVAIYTVGTTVNLVLILILARYVASLQAAGRTGAVRHVARRSGLLLLLPAAAFCVVVVVLSGHVAHFLRLDSPVPVIWLGLASAVSWFVAIPRGVLQGSQRFGGLSLNLSMELVVRTVTLVALLALGLAVTGSMVAILAGVAFAYGLGALSLRDLRRAQPEQVHLRVMAPFALTAVAGTLGVLWLFNVDVVLAKHYLSAQDAGLYGGLNKIETIVYYATLSVSQVLFPRVVEAIATRRQPIRLLVLSGALMTALGVCAMVVFAIAPGLVVGILYGPAFEGARSYVLAVGLIGLGLSLDNLLVQFLMAVHDRAFIPVLAGACVLLVGMVAGFHDGLTSIVADVAVVIFGLLTALILRCLLLMPRLGTSGPE